MRFPLCVALTLAVLISLSSAQTPFAEDSYVLNTISNDIYPVGIAIGSAGEIYVTSGKDQIFRSYDGHAFTVIAGKEHPRTLCCFDPSRAPDPLFSGDGGPAIDAYLDTPEGIAIASDGTIYFADSRNQRIRRVLKSGIIETVAGSGQAGFGGDDGPAIIATLNSPRGLAIDKQNNLYIADSGNHRIRMIQRTGAISTVAGNGKGFTGDGRTAKKAKLSYPSGIFVDDSGAIFIADTGNVRLRKVDPSGIIHTIAGTGEKGRNVGSGLAVKALLFSPQSLVVNRDGIFFTDLNRVRKISPDGTVKTIGGNGQVRGVRASDDGGPATASALYSTTIAISPQGTIYINDQVRLRTLTPIHE